MTDNNNLHVVFGTGPLGRAVVRDLYSHGRRVRAVNRSGKADFPASVEVIAADAYDVEQAAQVCQGASIVYQCAMPPYAKWMGNFPRLQTSILNAAARAQAKLVVADNLYLYGEVEGPIHEGLPATATTNKGRLRAQMAEELFRAHQSGKVRMTIGRGSDFFGPHVRLAAMGERVFVPAIAGKKAQVLGSLDMPHTYTFINDFGKALVMLAESESAYGRAWHVPNPETVTTREFLQIVYDTIGTTYKAAGLGTTMVRLVGIFVPAVRESVEMMYEFDKPFIVDATRFVDTFGFGGTPLREAVRQTVEWYRGLR